jgi:transporter family protein
LIKKVFPIIYISLSIFETNNGILSSEKEENMWIVYSLLAAAFASLVAILAKIGINGVNSNLAVAIRTVVVLLMSWLIVFITGKHCEITQITQKSWTFLILSGFATGVSWLFFYKALQIGDASKVVPIDKLSIVITMILAFVFLGETADIKTIVGGLLIAAGTLVLIL